MLLGRVRWACDDLRMDTSRDDSRAAERHERIGNPTICRAVVYRTDGRGGPAYDLPATITCTAATHPDATEEDLSGGWTWRDVPGNPVPIPCTHDGFVHLHVMTPGPTGQYTELTVPFDDGRDNADGEPRARSWRWPSRV